MAYSGDNGIVTLKTNDGEEVEFYDIAEIYYGGQKYEILQPVKLLDGMKHDEALVFKVTRVNGEDSFEIELTDSIVDGVFRQYNKLLDKQTGGNKKKLKKGGMGKIFGAAKSVAKVTWFIIKLLIGIAVTLLGAGLLLGAFIAGKDGIGIIGMVIMCVLGAVALSLGIRGIIKTVKNRKR